MCIRDSYVGSVGEPIFKNTWSGLNDISFRKDFHTGRVEIEGGCEKTTYTGAFEEVFRLPSGYIPSPAQVYFTTTGTNFTNIKHFQISILLDGSFNISILDSVVFAAANCSIYFNGIFYYA